MKSSEADLGACSLPADSLTPTPFAHLASHRYAIQTNILATPAVAQLPPEQHTTNAGYIHSIETGGTLDGPGIRFVAFLSGCHFRCQYCHNPDTWKLKRGLHVTVDDLMVQIERYADFLIKYGGGITLSGGEVMVQAPFVETLVGRIKARGLHVALDTNGYLGEAVSNRLIADTDLWLLDLKAYNTDLHTRITGQGNASVLAFARRLSGAGKAMWVRFVLVPGLTDDEDDIAQLADFVASLETVQRVEVLKFHQMGAFKWRELGLDYPLKNTQPPGDDLLNRVHRQFAARGLRVF
jgi:pyruvate formate lyase activating enzyme